MGIARIVIAVVLLAVGGTLAVVDAPFAVKEKKAAPKDRKDKDAKPNGQAPVLESDPDDIQFAQK